MRATACLGAKGFIGRSVDEFKRQFGIIIRSEAIRVPTKPYVLTSWHEKDTMEDIKLMSDADIGGFSKANIEWIPPVDSAPATSADNSKGHMRFTGNISIELPTDRPHIQRTGYAAWRTKDRKPTVFGKSLWDIDSYAFLALRIKSDGRKYFVNVQTESIVPTDLHQHRLYARKPGEWETIMIKWNEFVRTNHGMVVEPQSEMLRQKVKSVGIGLIDRVPGPFDLSIERIWASNGMNRADVIEDERIGTGQLKDKHGEKIRWGEGKGEKV